MALLVYNVGNYNHTAEREQYRALCKMLQQYYAEREELCIFVGNYNMNDIEYDGLLFKFDAVMCIEFKNYGGTIIATENGEWKLKDGTTIKGGSRKTVYLQAKINRAKLKHALKDWSILPEQVLNHAKALVVFHQDSLFENRLSAKVKSWLHITDTKHFMEKVEDITDADTDLSNEELLSLVEKLNLVEDFLDHNYSNVELVLPVDSDEEDDSHIDASQVPTPTTPPRVAPDKIQQLAPNEIFVFGSNIQGKHFGGAAKIAWKDFGAQWGVGEGHTGQCYAIPTMCQSIEYLKPFIERFILFAHQHPELKFLVTRVGCGVAGFTASDIAPLFAPAQKLENVFLPADFWFYLKQ